MYVVKEAKRFWRKSALHFQSYKTEKSSSIYFNGLEIYFRKSFWINILASNVDNLDFYFIRDLLVAPR